MWLHPFRRSKPDQKGHPLRFMTTPKSVYIYMYLTFICTRLFMCKYFNAYVGALFDVLSTSAQVSRTPGFTHSHARTHRNHTHTQGHPKESTLCIFTFTILYQACDLRACSITSAQVSRTHTHSHTDITHRHTQRHPEESKLWQMVQATHKQIWTQFIVTNIFVACPVRWRGMPTTTGMDEGAQERPIQYTAIHVYISTGL
jgi:hypothetical protein